MYMLLTLALVCTAAASSGYGSSYNRPSYPGYSYGGYDYGYDSRSGSSSSEERRNKCRKPRELEIPTNSGGFTGTKARFSFLERKGKSYIKLSCPDDGKSYVLVGDQNGVTDYPEIPNLIFLAEGINIDLVGRCRGKRISVKSMNRGDVKVKKVACVWLKGNEITAL